MLVENIVVGKNEIETDRGGRVLTALRLVIQSRALTGAQGKPVTS